MKHKLMKNTGMLAALAFSAAFAETTDAASLDDFLAGKTVNSDAVAETRDVAKIDDALPYRRVLTRPGAMLYAAPDGRILDLYLPYYSIMNVCAEQGEWLQVQYMGQEGVLGWVKKDATVEWKHRLVVKFPVFKDCNPLLFFESREAALRYSRMSDSTREARVSWVYDAIAKGVNHGDPSIVACESAVKPNMANNFFLLPITEFALDDSEYGNEYDARALKVVAVTENRVNEPDLNIGMAMDLVFVMDLTGTMAPVKDRIKETIAGVVQKVKDNPKFSSDIMRFGFWGYRDSVEACNGIEFVTKNYTEAGLQSPAEFMDTLDRIETTTVDSVDYCEDMLAGMRDAIEKTPWREDAARVIILIGDAPGREPGKEDPFSRHKNKPVGTQAEMSPEEIAALADRNHIVVGSVYINNPRHKMYLPLGRKQFAALSGGEDAKASYVLASNQLEELDAFLGDVISFLAAQMFVNNQEGGTKSADSASSLFANAKVRWLGEAHMESVTGEMSGWVLDKDLLNSGIDSVEPCVLLTRQQLGSMITMLNNVVGDARNRQLNATELLTALKQVVVVGVSAPELLGDVEKLSDSRLVPAFMKELPYHSTVMCMSHELWEAMTLAEQDEFIESIEHKIKCLESMHADGSVWSNPDEHGQEMCPIPMNMIP